MPSSSDIRQSPQCVIGKDTSWYKSELGSLPEPARRLLETYSHIPPDQVIPHILAIRDRAWDIWPYPCLGKLNFLDLSISQSPGYPDILTRLTKSNQTLLDLGCCLAQDLRKLVSDGVPSENLYGLELRQAFIDLGYELFQDRASLRCTFLVGNILEDDATGELLKDIVGKIDIIYAASIFHLFNWRGQLFLAKRAALVLRPVSGSLILGRQRGNVKAGEYEHRLKEKETMFRHNEESFKKMWDEVGRAQELHGTLT